VGGKPRYYDRLELSLDVHAQTPAVSVKILALCAREVVSALEQCSNVLLSQVFPISMFNEALLIPP